MVIERYPQGWGYREDRKAGTRVQRRADDRQIGVGTEVPVPLKARGRKDRRRWCQGRAGVPHQPEWRPYVGRLGISLPGWYEEVCTVCGKKLSLEQREVAT